MYETDAIITFNFGKWFYPSFGATRILFPNINYESSVYIYSSSGNSYHIVRMSGSAVLDIR